MRVVIYIEGGGDSKDLQSRCRAGFRKLLEGCGFKQCMPRLIACGSRGTAYKDFKTAHQTSHAHKLVFMLVDSEEPMRDIERAWEHLQRHDQWTRPSSAEDWQVLLMVTCMETWIIADQEALRSHCGNKLQTNTMPDPNNLEQIPRDEVQIKLAQATARCTSSYRKGKRSFEYLSRIAPEPLGEHLPSFRRCVRILKEHLGSPGITGQPR